MIPAKRTSSGRSVKPSAIAKLAAGLTEQGKERPKSTESLNSNPWTDEESDKLYTLMRKTIHAQRHKDRIFPGYGLEQAVWTNVSMRINKLFHQNRAVFDAQGCRQRWSEIVLAEHLQSLEEWLQENKDINLPNVDDTDPQVLLFILGWGNVAECELSCTVTWTRCAQILRKRYPADKSKYTDEFCSVRYHQLALLDGRAATPHEKVKVKVTDKDKADDAGKDKDKDKNKDKDEAEAGDKERNSTNEKDEDEDAERGETESPAPALPLVQVSNLEELKTLIIMDRRAGQNFSPTSYRIILDIGSGCFEELEVIQKLINEVKDLLNPPRAHAPKQTSKPSSKSSNESTKRRPIKPKIPVLGEQIVTILEQVKEELVDPSPHRLTAPPGAPIIVSASKPGATASHRTVFVPPKPGGTKIATPAGSTASPILMAKSKGPAGASKAVWASPTPQPGTSTAPQGKQMGKVSFMPILPTIPAAVDAFKAKTKTSPGRPAVGELILTGRHMMGLKKLVLAEGENIDFEQVSVGMKLLFDVILPPELCKSVYLRVCNENISLDCSMKIFVGQPLPKPAPPPAPKPPPRPIVPKDMPPPPQKTVSIGDVLSGETLKKLLTQPLEKLGAKRKVVVDPNAAGADEPKNKKRAVITLEENIPEEIELDPDYRPHGGRSSQAKARKLAPIREDTKRDEAIEKKTKKKVLVLEEEDSEEDAESSEKEKQMKVVAIREEESEEEEESEDDEAERPPSPTVSFYRKNDQRFFADDDAEEAEREEVMEDSEDGEEGQALVRNTTNGCFLNYLTGEFKPHPDHTPVFDYMIRIPGKCRKFLQLWIPVYKTLVEIESPNLKTKGYVRIPENKGCKEGYGRLIIIDGATKASIRNPFELPELKMVDSKKQKMSELPFIKLVNDKAEFKQVCHADGSEKFVKKKVSMQVCIPGSESANSVYLEMPNCAYIAIIESKNLPKPTFVKIARYEGVSKEQSLVEFKGVEKVSMVYQDNKDVGFESLNLRDEHVENLRKVVSDIEPLVMEKQGIKHLTENSIKETKTDTLCVICYKMFDSVQELETHQRKLKSKCGDPEGKIYKCRFCRIPYSQNEDFLEHMVTKHPRKDHFWRCKICGETEPIEKAMHSHIKEHFSEKVHRECPLCGMQHHSGMKIRQHMNNYGSVRPWGCAKCTQKFMTKRCLQKHMESHSEGRHPCPHCEYTSKRPDTLKEHIKFMHELEGECDICGRTFQSKDSLFKHKKCHVTGLACDVCGSVFKKSEHLVMHVEVAKNGWDSCERGQGVNHDANGRPLKSYSRNRGPKEEQVKKNVQKKASQQSQDETRQAVASVSRGSSQKTSISRTASGRFRGKVMPSMDVEEEEEEEEDVVEDIVKLAQEVDDAIGAGQDEDSSSDWDETKPPEKAKKPAQKKVETKQSAAEQAKPAMQTFSRYITEVSRTFIKIDSEHGNHFIEIAKNFAQTADAQGQVDIGNLTKCLQLEDGSLLQMSEDSYRSFEIAEEVRSQALDASTMVVIGVHSEIALSKCADGSSSTSIDPRSCCDICGKSLTTDTPLLDHMEKKHPAPPDRPTAIFHCDQCERKFKLACYLDEHIATFHRTHQCQKCPILFRTPKGLQEHKCEGLQSSLSMKCAICPKNKDIYRSVEALLDHIKTDHPKCQHVCKTCCFNANSALELKNHMDKLHANPSRYQCPRCMARSSSAKQFRQHILQHLDSQLWPHQCELCFRRFSTQYGLRSHNTRAHPPWELFECKVCLKTMETYPDLRQHLTDAHGQRSIVKCVRCKELVPSDKHTEHWETCPGTLYSCKFCGQGFLNNDDLLAAHLATHSTPEGDEADGLEEVVY